MAPYRSGNSYKTGIFNPNNNLFLRKEELLDKYLKEFRVEQCPLFLQHKCQQHRPFACFNWHFQNQRRRRPLCKQDGLFNYSADVYCTKYDETTGICSDGDECPYLHRTAGDTERRYHLKYYKTGMCVHDTDARGYCVKNGPHCAFAHGGTDLRPPIYDIRELHAIEHGDLDVSIAGPNSLDKERCLQNDDPKWMDVKFVLANYKTELCKKPPRLCRQGYACPQFHNNKDKRRSPKIYKYRSTPCPNVKTGDEWGDPAICESGDACQYCHTRTEQQFHPEIYKSTKCNDIQNTCYCPRGPFCAFAHIEHEILGFESPIRSPSSSDQTSPNFVDMMMTQISNSVDLTEQQPHVQIDLIPPQIHQLQHLKQHLQNRSPDLFQSEQKGNNTGFQTSRPSLPPLARNGSITPPFEENGFSSPIDTSISSVPPHVSTVPQTACNSSAGSSINSNLSSPHNVIVNGDMNGSQQTIPISEGSSSTLLNRDAFISRQLFAIDADKNLSHVEKLKRKTSLMYEQNFQTGISNRISPSYFNGCLGETNEGLVVPSSGLDDIFGEDTKSRKSSGFSEIGCGGIGNGIVRNHMPINLNGTTTCVCPNEEEKSRTNQSLLSGTAPVCIPAKNDNLSSLAVVATCTGNGNRSPLTQFQPNSLNHFENNISSYVVGSQQMNLYSKRVGGGNGSNKNEDKDAEICRLREELLRTRNILGVTNSTEEVMSPRCGVPVNQEGSSVERGMRDSLNMGLLDLKSLPFGVLKKFEFQLRKNLQEVERIIHSQQQGTDLWSNGCTSMSPFDLYNQNQQQNYMALKNCVSSWSSLVPSNNEETSSYYGAGAFSSSTTLMPSQIN